ncbi:MAG: polyhydroxyalkanoic acid system family protein [Luteimonas sp.]
MANIDLQHAHSLPHAEARQAVEEAIARLGQKLGIEHRWEGDTLHFTRPGVDGRIALTPGHVHVTAALGMLFSAMKGKVESELKRMLEERLP